MVKQQMSARKNQEKRIQFAITRPIGLCYLHTKLCRLRLLIGNRPAKQERMDSTKSSRTPLS